MSQTIFFHNQQQELMPVGAKFDHTSNISTYVDLSISSIIIQDLLDYYTDSNIIGELYPKLVVGGTLEIQSIDLKQMGIAVAFGDLRLEMARFLLYPHKKNIYTMKAMIDIITPYGFEVEVKKYVNSFEYYVLFKKL